MLPVLHGFLKFPPAEGTNNWLRKLRRNLNVEIYFPVGQPTTALYNKCKYEMISFHLCSSPFQRPFRENILEPEFCLTWKSYRLDNMTFLPTSKTPLMHLFLPKQKQMLYRYLYTTARINTQTSQNQSSVYGRRNNTFTALCLKN